MKDVFEKARRGNGGEGSSVSYEELARLISEELEPEEREEIIRRVSEDPIAMQVLALAVSESGESGGLSDEAVDRLMGLVKESSLQKLCANCGGELVVGGNFCPHCGMRVGGKISRCARCGKPIAEGSGYCPHCGCSFRGMVRGSWIDSPVLMLVIGLISLLIGLFYKPVALVFLPLGGIGLGVWFNDLWMRWKAQTQKGEEERVEERYRRTG